METEDIEITKVRKMLESEEKEDTDDSAKYARRTEKERQNDVQRREMIFELFKGFVGREMTEAEYQRYLLDFKNIDAERYWVKNNRRFNLFEWVADMGLKEKTQNGI